MDFRLTKEEALFQKMCREFALNEVEPLAAEIDEQERYPEETVQKLMKYGLMGIQFPKEVGGSGGTYVCYSIAIEEMSRVRHRGAEGEVAPSAHRAQGRREDRCVRSDRAQRRHGLRCAADHRCQAGGRLLHPQRHQGVHHRRRPRGYLCRFRNDR